FVSNSDYRPIPNALYRNDGSGEFSKVTDSGLSGEIPTGGGGCWADYDNDGFLDLLLDNEMRVSLNRNNTDGTFSDVTDDAGIAETILPNTIFYKCAWGDYDNDGFVDLFVGSGDFSRDASKQYVGPPRLHNFLYHNAGDGTFTKVTEGSIVTDLTTQGASA